VIKTAASKATQIVTLKVITPVPPVFSAFYGVHLYIRPEMVEADIEERPLAPRRIRAQCVTTKRC
jgi:hypothetical protein